MAAKRRRARRSRRSSRRSASSRWMLIGGIVLALGYFVFTRFVFDPFEAAQPRFDLLVPRDVDLFVRRERLDVDFDPFPRPALLDSLEVDQHWRDLTSGAWWTSLEWPADLERLADDLRAQLSGSPLDPESLLAGEVALAGRNVATDGRYALLARLSTKGKLAVEGLALEGVFEEALPDARREVVAHPDLADVDYWHVTQADGSELFYARESDTLILGQDEQLLRDVLETLHRDPEQSLGLSRLWNDHLPAAGGAAEAGPSFELALDAGQVLASLELLPDLEEPDRDALADIWPRIVDVSLLRDAVGRLELLGGRLRAMVHSELDVAGAKLDHGGLLGMPAFGVAQRVRERMGLLPADVAVCLTMNVEMRRLLTVLHQGLGPDVKQLLDGSLRDVSKWNQDLKILDVQSLVTQLSRVVGDELTLAVRPRLTPVAPGLQPLPELAVIMPLSDPLGWDAIEKFFLRGYRELGLDDEQMLRTDEGVGVRKWVSVPGLPFDEIAWMVLDNETLVLTTSNPLLQEMVDVFSLRRESLARSGRGDALLAELRRADSLANLAGYVAADGLLDILRPYGAWLADLDTLLDFGVLRVQRQRELLQRQFGGRSVDELSEGDQAALDAQLDQRLGEEERVRREETVPRLAAEWVAGFDWLRVLRQGVLALRLGDRSADLRVELATTLER